MKERQVSAVTPPLRARGLWGYVVGIGLFLVVVAFIPAWGEPFTMPKVTLATVTALAASPLLWLRRTQLLTNRWPVGLAGVFLLLTVASTLFSGAPLLGSFFGDWGRRSGSLFVVVLVLILAVASVMKRAELRIALAWLMWAGVPATAYGLVQMVGADPFPWTDQGWVISTFGNPNFAAAGLSMLALVTAALAAFGGFAVIWRVLMAPLAALEALVALSTGSSLVVFALATGVLAGALAWALRLSGSRRNALAALLLGVAVLSGFLAVLGLLGSGPLAAAVSPDTLQFRRWYWGAGANMALRHPIFGVGPDGFGRFYGEFRSPEAAQMYSLGVNNSHDVPLQWAATLGIPAAVVYVALVILVAAVVLRRLWRQGPSASLLAIPLLALWTAYQVQSLVSIDETAVSFMGWFAAGALLAATSPASDTSDPVTPRGAWVAVGALGLVGLLLWMPSLLTSNASRTVVQGTTESDVLQAVDLVQGSLLPCQGAAPVAQWMTSVAPSEPTVNAVFAYVDRDSRCYRLTNAAADFAIQLEQPELAVDLAQEAVAIDPLNYAPWLLLARAQSLAGNSAAAQQAIDEAARLAPGNGEVIAIAEQLRLTLPGPPA